MNRLPTRTSARRTDRFGLMIKAKPDLSFAPALFYEHAGQPLNTLQLPGVVA